MPSTYDRIDGVAWPDCPDEVARPSFEDFFEATRRL
jgi:hypothetical protein